MAQADLTISNLSLFESLFSATTDAIAIFSLDAEVIAANPAYGMLFGYNSSELHGRALPFTIGHDETVAITAHRQVIEQGISVVYEGRKLRKDGTFIEVSVTLSPIRNDLGRIIAVSGIARDVTPQKELQDELFEAKRLFEIISENSQDIISYSYPDGTFGYISPSVKPLLGYDPDELVGKPISLLFHEEDSNYLAKINGGILAGEDPARFTCRVRSKSGNFRWYETTIRIIRDEAGNVLQIVGVGRDISEQMNLQESLEHAARIAGLGHWERDLLTNRITYSNQMCRILGLDLRHKAFTFEEYQECIHPEDKEMAAHRVQQAIDTGSPFSAVYRIVRRNGTVCYLHSQAEVILNEDGVPARLLGTAQDITEQKTLEMQLKQSEERYRSLVENSLDAICIFEDNKWVFMNKNGLEMFGVTREDEVIGYDYLDFLDGSHHEESRRRRQAILSGEPVRPVEYKWVRNNGEVFDAEVLGSKFGENAVQICIRDITERKRTNELLLRTEKLSAVGQLAAGVAHEIRNPLTTLKGFLQLMHEKATGDNRRYFELMQSELSRMEMTLGELLLLAKPQAVRYTIRDIALLLNEVVAFMGTQAIMNSVQMETVFERDLPQVKCEPNQLKQVFINIIKNALEAMSKGGTLSIRVACIENHICITFVDQGEGIPADKLQRLGEPFFSTKDKGTGLGLMVTHRIIHDHGGKIHFRSTVGEGTTVCITLPGIGA